MGLFGKSKKEPAAPHVDVAQLVREGVEHLQAERWHDAISTLETALASAPDSPVVRAYLTQAYARAGNGEAATRHFEHVRKGAPATATQLAEQDPWLTAGRKVMHLGTSQRGGNTYESYACADPTAAKDFLQARDVDRPNYYVDVDTPDGIWGKDLDSLYQARLPAWKTDLSLAECDGSATGFGDIQGIGRCAKGLSDNFTARVTCGRCDHDWLDALRYQDVTVARCPSCGTYNRIDSHNFHVTLVVDGMLPNDRLRALRPTIDRLTSVHPPNEPVVASRVAQQLPWISQQLEEAASALESGADYLGNPITETQVAAGLRQLTGIVREAGYLTTMETAYPGIARPLQQCMDQLDVVVTDIEAGGAEAVPSSKGVDTIIELTGPGILFPSTYVDRAVEELRAEGEPGSKALAVLIRELLACRSPVILDALEVAGQVVSVPELRDALHAVAESPERAEQPARARFAPEIVGNGRVGWTSVTHMIACGRAMEALTPGDQGA